MKIKKIHLDDMYRAYAASHMQIEGKGEVVFIASEEKGHPCYMYYGDNFENRETVWEDGGGCMNIIPIPNRTNEFLAIRDFYQKESPSSARLVHGEYKNNEWKITELFKLAYLHRFDVISMNNEVYLVCATIADLKDNKEDWSRPGSVYAAKLPADLNEKIHLEKIAEGLFINHGFYKHTANDKETLFFGANNGLYKLEPQGSISTWKLNLVLDKPIGEIALNDINQDGIDELITIEPFHGDQIKIYELKDNQYTSVYDYPVEINFAHTLVGAKLQNKSVFVGGIRRVNPDLFYIDYTNGTYQHHIIDAGCGPSNVSVFNLKDKDVIVSANHTGNEAAIYIVERE